MNERTCMQIYNVSYVYVVPWLNGGNKRGVAATSRRRRGARALLYYKDLRFIIIIIAIKSIKLFKLI